MPKIIFRLICGVFIITLVWHIASSIRNMMPQEALIIETGPVTGTYYQYALEYEKAMKAKGFTVRIQPNDQTATGLERINQIPAKADIGFMVLEDKDNEYKNVRAIGTVAIQPLFVFYSSGLGEIATLNNLRGKHLVLPPEQSVTSVISRQILKLYGIDERNTSFTYLPLDQIVIELTAGKFDAGFFILGPENKIISKLTASENLQLYSFEDAVGITRKLPYLRPTKIPRASYDLAQNLPPEDISVVGAVINVVARKDLPAAFSYALLEGLESEHHKQTIVSATGTFPSGGGTLLALNPQAAEYYKKGVPWIYRTFSPLTAMLIDKYLYLGLALFLLSEIYKTSRYLYEFSLLVLESYALRIATYATNVRNKNGKLGPLTALLLRYAERVLSRKTIKQRASDLINAPPK